MSDVRTRIEDSFKTGFIDRGFNPENPFQSKLNMNEADNSPLLSNVILEQLSNCDSFTFQISFITSDGLQLLKKKMQDLDIKRVRGRLLTSTMNDFNRPKMFRELMKIGNLDVRIAREKKFHAKGYLFSFGEHKTVIVGSSNLTSSALRTNRELNVLFHSTHDGKIIDNFESSFEEDWGEGTPLSHDWIDAYESTSQEGGLAVSSRVFDMMPHELEFTHPSVEIEPNNMQIEALRSLTELRAEGNEKALVISATGTGKTYLSAFDVRNFDPTRCLYIAHREQILIRSRSSFQRVLGLRDSDFGILSGKSKDYSNKFIFATIQSLVREIQRFDPEDFDYIIIDEVHRAGAPSYERVFDHFRPGFMLGMSATPERTDEFNVFQLFDNNVAYEIRLKRALEENLLVPFHYFGVSDFEINGEVIDDNSRLSKVDHSERVDFLLEKIEYYGHGGEYLRGLVFCSRKSEGLIVSEILNSRGYRSVFLSGDDSQERRVLEINKLEKGDLDYIVTVDIFNEGVDIPCINQVVMLRQTQSSIVFIQQLGRGLRLDEGKDYLTVIDCIGNYENNFLIPIALSGRESHDKDDLRMFLSNTDYMTGLSSVNFEEIAKQRIYQSINNAKLGSMRNLIESYRKLRQRLDRVPYPTDFVNHHSVDPEVIMKKMSYSRFLIRNGEQGFEFDSLEESFLNFIGLELMNGFRLHEIDIIRSLITKKIISVEGQIQEISSSWKPRESINSAIRVLSLEFLTSRSRERYAISGSFIIQDGDEIRFNPKLESSFEENGNFRSLCDDILRCARIKNTEHYSLGDPMKLYKKYGRKDVCRLLNWQNDETSTVYGYRIKNETCPIFITYNKSSEIEESVRYEDSFLDQETIHWFTKNNRTFESKEVRKILNHHNNEIDIHVFVKKDDDEGTSFYYLGRADVKLGSQKEEVMVGGNDVVSMDLTLRNKVPMNVYDYFVKSDS